MLTALVALCSITVSVHDFDVDAYKAAEGWKDFENIVAIEKTAVSLVVAAEKEAEAFSLSGVRVGKDYKGIVIRDGKKFLKR